MTQLDDVATQDGWRCWVCDEAVDPAASVNDDRGPSVDSRTSSKKAVADFAGLARLAHRTCNSRKGALTPVIPWPTALYLVEPAPLLAVADRLARKGGREVVVRSPNQADATQAARWLEDRFTRLAPLVPVTASVEPAGGQFIVALATARRR